MRSSIVAALSLFLSVTLAAPLNKRFPHLQLYIDDQGDTEITYASNGQQWYHESGLCGPYKGTQSYNNDLSASYSFPYAGGDTSFVIYGSRKHDRGNFDVFLNGKYIGSGDAYDAGLQQEGPSVALFTYNEFSTTGQLNTVQVKNKADARLPNSTPWLFVDFVYTSS